MKPHPPHPAGFLSALVAGLLTLAAMAQGTSSTTPNNAPAATSTNTPAANATESEEGDDTEPEEPAATNGTNAPAGSSTNLTSSATSDSSTNAPTRRSRRSGRSSRGAERTGLRDWRPGSGSSSTNSAATNGPAQTEYAYFQLVNDRNIFNPARVPNRPDRPRSSDPKRQPKVESLSLVGTLRYEKGSIAFFDGSSPEFRKPLKPGDSIAGHQIVSVTDSLVRLVAKDQPVDLKVGSQLRREDDGPWTLAAGTGPSSSSSGSSNSNSSSSSDSTSSASSSAGGADDILKRLRERRAQESQK